MINTFLSHIVSTKQNEKNIQENYQLLYIFL